MTTLSEAMFSVRVDSERYLTDVEVGRRGLEVTNIPSYARHCNYTLADQTTQRLRRRGFKQCIVTDHLGAPVTDAAIRAFLIADRIEHDSPANQAQLDEIPVGEVRRRTRRDAAFRARVVDIKPTPLRHW